MDTTLLRSNVVTHRLPVGSYGIALVPATLVVIGWLLSDAPGAPWFPVLMVAIAAAGIGFRARQRLVLDGDGVAITVLRTRRLRWAEVERFEATPSGGIRVVTAARSYRSPAPCSGWGGPATDAQVARLVSQRASFQR